MCRHSYSLVVFQSSGHVMNQIYVKNIYICPCNTISVPVRQHFRHNLKQPSDFICFHKNNKIYEKNDNSYLFLHFLHMTLSSYTN